MNLLEFRHEKDQFFKSRNSPLKAAYRPAFTGLLYYPENVAMRFICHLEPDPTRAATVMQTSTGSQVVYERLGWVEFTVAETAARLAVFAPEGELEPQQVFVPFRDATSGQTTYSAGRYLEAHLTGNTVQLDFNVAYNPYCAYSDGWSCPIPPPENWLTVAIEAGEKTLAKLEAVPVQTGGDDD